MFRILKFMTAAALSAAMILTPNMKVESQTDEPIDQSWRHGMAEAAEFDAQDAIWQDGCGIDVSHVEEGYVIISCVSDKELRFVIRHNKDQIHYPVQTDGTSTIIPLTYGNGNYELMVAEHMEGTKHRVIWKLSLDIELIDDEAPYRYTNIYVPYTGDCQCVRTAEMIAVQAGSAGQFISMVEDYVSTCMSYDGSYVATTLDGHEINPDTFLVKKTGICLDYASCITAMLRSQGIPARLVFGDADDGGGAYYHAWTEAHIGSQWIIIDALMPDGKGIYYPEQYF